MLVRAAKVHGVFSLFITCKCSIACVCACVRACLLASVNHRRNPRVRTELYVHCQVRGRTKESRTAYSTFEGNIHVLDRAMDTLCHGEMIYPLELEDTLHHRPAVKMAAVIGVPTAKADPEDAHSEDGSIKMFVRLREPLNDFTEVLSSFESCLRRRSVDRFDASSTNAI
ncbi:uncharacterized protein LOC111268461 [Varroa jacobsoni]|uniref:uncharacterized protein LOC111268461 n=1 Tax=Varroa jacobsoni TaxID=62625 RepID=UPI000BF32B29|nr:uncharacterized protein LOC111268461 [Varroa jacobsoni]